MLNRLGHYNLFANNFVGYVLFPFRHAIFFTTILFLIFCLFVLWIVVMMCLIGQANGLSTFSDLMPICLALVFYQFANSALVALLSLIFTKPTTGNAILAFSNVLLCMYSIQCDQCNILNFRIISSSCSLFLYKKQFQWPYTVSIMALNSCMKGFVIFWWHVHWTHFVVQCWVYLPWIC